MGARFFWTSIALAMLTCSCGGDGEDLADAAMDANGVDAAADGSAPDSGMDSGRADSGLADGDVTLDGAADDARSDAASTDASLDSATTDSGATDAGVDGALPDGSADAGLPCTVGCEVVQLVGGFAHTCALRENGSVLCWGSNEEGELGDGRMLHSGDCTPPGSVDTVDCTSNPQQVVDVPSSVQITAKSGRSACARTEGDEVYCWGREPIADPATGDFERRFTAELIGDFSGARDVSDAQSFTCAVMADNTVSCLGQNDAGQLGDDTVTDRSTADSVMGLSAALDVEAAADFGEFACAITTSDVQCWGENEFLQLGDGETTHTECGALDEARDCSLTPVTVSGLTPPEQLALGIDHACARHSDGSIACWGQNTSRQLGMDESGPVATPTTVTAISGVQQLAAGGFHTCALLDDGSVECWGANDQGQLGDGSLDHGSSCGIGGTTGDCSATPVAVALPTPGTASYIACGRKHSCALMTTGEVWCWGWNDRRQLGIDDRTAQPTPVMVGIP